MTKRWMGMLAVGMMIVLGLGVQAQTAPTGGTGKVHHVVFAVTSGDEADWKMTLGNIRNLMSGLKPDVVEVEVVAYSEGINLVKVGSTMAEEIVALQGQGVKFVACQNSMRMRKLELKDLLPGLTPVPSGIVEVVTKQEQGWAYIKGGR